MSLLRPHELSALRASTPALQASARGQPSVPRLARDPELVEGQGAKHRVEACKKAKMVSCRRLFAKLQNS
jgi:hypothetical protein